MPSPVEQTLENLLPTVNFLPPELIELANFLLAQSRAKAASLRPDEEIGRTYACCHIACERLSKKLDLEPAKATPPLKPKVYAKLKTYLDSVLKASASTGTTPKTLGGRFRDGLRTPTNKESIPKTLRDPARTPSKTPVSHVKPLTSPDQNLPLPGYVAKLVSGLSNTYKCGGIEPHVLAGLASVYSLARSLPSQSRSDEPPSRKRRKAASQSTHLDLGIDQMLPVLATVLFWRVKELLNAQSDFRSSYDSEHDRLMLFVIDFYDNNSQIFADGPNAKQIDDSFEYWAQQAIHVWPQTQWFRDITHTHEKSAEEKTQAKEVRPPKNMSGQQGRRSAAQPSRTPLGRREKDGRPNSNVHTQNRAGLLPGLGTMFQPAIDWLSEERCTEFEQWKADIMLRVQAVEEMQAQASAAG